MKRIICAVLVAVMALALAVSASAATKQDVIDKFEASVPENYHPLILGQVENILNQIDITEEQADKLIALMDETAANMSKFTDKGHSLEAYVSEERDFCVGQFSEACDVLGLTYTISTKANGYHSGDEVYSVYDASGKKLGDLDGDIDVKTTDKVETSVVLPAAAVVLAVLAGFSAVVAKKRFEER